VRIVKPNNRHQHRFTTVRAGRNLYQSVVHAMDVHDYLISGVVMLVLAALAYWITDLSQVFIVPEAVVGSVLLLMAMDDRIDAEQ
jgi:hypothetical protein